MSRRDMGVRWRKFLCGMFFVGTTVIGAAFAQEHPSAEIDANEAFDQWRSMPFEQQIEKRRNSTVLPSSTRIAEWLRDPQNAALARASALEQAREYRDKTLIIIVIVITIFGMATWLSRLIWRHRCRLARLIEDAIVVAGAGLLRTQRAVQSGAARIRNRILDRAK